MGRLMQEAARLAGTRLPLLITGETGTGKERLARALHMCGPRGRGFRALRCAGLSAEEIPAEASGSVLLRGVEDLSPAAQDRLLGLLDAGPEGRILATSRLSPEALAQVLRPDLYYRLAGAVIALPPLRHRADFDWLVDRLLRRHSADDLRFSPAARAELKSRDWPGNIRELDAALQVAVLGCEGAVLDLPDLPPAPRAATAPPGRPGGGADRLRLEHGAGGTAAGGQPLHRAAPDAQGGPDPSGLTCPGFPVRQPSGWCAPPGRCLNGWLRGRCGWSRSRVTLVDCCVLGRPRLTHSCHGGLRVGQLHDPEGLFARLGDPAKACRAPAFGVHWPEPKALNARHSPTSVGSRPPRTDAPTSPPVAPPLRAQRRAAVPALF